MYEFNEEHNEKRFIGQANEYNFIIGGQTDNLEQVIKQRNEKELSEGLKKYMPIGSVITINGSNQLLMIIGFNYEMNNIKYDYIGCFYPFGVDVAKLPQLFNHNQIERVYNVGYINEQEKKFKKDLRDDEEINFRGV